MSLERSMRKLRESLDRMNGTAPAPKRRRFRATPRDRVTAHLLTAGIHVFPDDITTLQGAWRHNTFDCLDKWSVMGTLTATGKRVEVTGLDTLTECQRGIVLEPNDDPRSQHYGDYIASAAHKRG